MIKTIWYILLAAFLIASCGNLEEINGIEEIVGEDDKKEDDELSGLEKLEQLQAETELIRLSGFFIDAAVEGISYKSSFSGTTDSTGRFFYYSGDNVMFTIGNIELGTVTGSIQITPVDLASSAITDQKTVNLLRFLQTLDDDGNPDNGIKIPAAVRTAAADMSVNFDQTTSAFETAVATDISTLTSNLSIGTTGLTSAASAVTHFQSTVTTSQATDNQIATVENAPTALSLSATSVDSGSSSGTTVGTLSSTDPDSGDEHTYSLVSGTGSTDNGSFSISSTTLSMATSVNYASQTSYSIRIRSTDLTSQTYEESVTINVNGIALSPSTVAEGSSSGTTVGTLTGSLDGSDAVSFSLVSGTGSTDNGSFSISGSSLLTAASFDFETQSSHSIRVQLVNAIGGIYEQSLTITITNSESPTDIALSASSVAENSASGTTIGTLSCTDADSSSFTYSLVSGTGDTDNSSFSISDSTLSTAASFDYETATSKSIRIQCSDGTNTYSEAFTISVTNVEEAPTDVSLSSSTLSNPLSSKTVGTFSTTDADSGDSHTYSLTSGTDNFSVSGSTLSAISSFLPPGSYSITVRTTDSSSLTYDETMTITVSGGLLGGTIQGSPLSLSGIVTTIAGAQNTNATLDGTGTAAQFNEPNGGCTDGTNLYIPEDSGHVIRQIVIATGVVTTLAGQAGSSGAVDGTGTAAKFNNPNDCTTDGTNVYVADQDNHAIRQIVISTGVVTTLAGSLGSSGTADGTGTAAGFNRPEGITTDSTYLYVTDKENDLIRRIVIATGVVTTIAGDGTSAVTDGTGTSASFGSPWAITTDGTNLYITEFSNHVIRQMVISTGVVTTLAGSDGNSGTTDGTGTAATFWSPYGITTDGTNLYVTDRNSSLLRKIVISTGVVTTLAGDGTSNATDGTGTAAALGNPEGITSDGTYLYFPSSGKDTIRRME